MGQNQTQKLACNFVNAWRRGSSRQTGRQSSQHKWCAEEVVLRQPEDTDHEAKVKGHGIVNHLEKRGVEELLDDLSLKC